MSVGFHHTDTSLGGRNVRRVISSFLNYRTPAGVWAPADPDVEDAPTPPPAWSGQYEFTHASTRGALQIFIGDTTDAQNTALIGVRLNDEPDHWINLKAVNVNPGVAMQVNRAGRRVRWPGLWDFTNLEWHMGRGRLDKRLILTAPGHPNGFRFAMRFPQGHTYNFSNDGRLRVFDATGKRWISTALPWGEDANGKRIRVDTVEGVQVTQAGNTYPTIRLVPNASDLATAVYPVTVDPTLVINNPTDIRDALLYGGPSHVDENYGASGSLWVGRDTNGEDERSVIAIETAAIPAGVTMTAFRLKLWRAANGHSTQNNGTIQFFRIKAANTWVEGSASGPPAQTGSVSWASCKHGSQAWAGSVGCGTSGTDYDADGSPPNITYDAYTSGPNVEFTVTLPVTWLTGWRDGGVVNNGIIMREFSTLSGRFFLCGSSDNGTIPAAFEIDYDGGSKDYYRQLINRGRR